MTDILIVDDDPGILSTLREILELNGFTVETSADAADAIDKIKKTPFLIALLDIKLPDMEGTRLLMEIRKIRPAIKCIMVTGFASLDNAVQSLNSGAAGYVMKPVNPGDLVNTIREKIREIEAENEITEDKVTEWASDQLLRLS
jgi:DNA-binding NtrC family response regulator